MSYIENDIPIGNSTINEKIFENIDDLKSDLILGKVQILLVLSICTSPRSTKRMRKISKKQKNYCLKSNCLHMEEKNESTNNFQELGNFDAEKIRCLLEKSNLSAIKLVVIKWNTATDLIFNGNLKIFSSSKFSPNFIIVCVPRLSYQLYPKISIEPLLVGRELSLCVFVFYVYIVFFSDSRNSFSMRFFSLHTIQV